jgi:hypothetical protein
MKFFARLFHALALVCGHVDECGTCRQAEDEKRLWQTRFFTELDSNRLREDEWAASFLQLQGARTIPGQRTKTLNDTVFDPPTLPADDPENNPTPDNPHSLSFDQLQELEDIYRQMIDNAKDRGIDISDEYVSALRGEIFLLHPERYLR